MDITIETDGPQVTAKVAGEVDAHNCSELGEAILQAATAESPSVTIDASDLGFIDSSAISELLRVRTELEGRGGTLTIANTSSTVRRVLEITGLLETFGVT
jgi:anti-sigma B factor antagonist